MARTTARKVAKHAEGKIYRTLLEPLRPKVYNLHIEDIIHHFYTMFRLFLAKVIFRLSLYKIFVLLDVFKKFLKEMCDCVSYKGVSVAMVVS